jgi:hypothetical protein
MSEERDKKMSVGERDKKMSDIASLAAEVYAQRNDADGNERDITFRPQEYLQYTVPYLTVRTLQRQEKALNSLEADSRWIKFLTIVLVILTAVLAYYAFRLDTLIHSLQKTPPAATSSPTASPVTH